MNFGRFYTDICYYSGGLLFVFEYYEFIDHLKKHSTAKCNQRQPPVQMPTPV